MFASLKNIGKGSSAHADTESAVVPRTADGPLSAAVPAPPAAPTAPSPFQEPAPHDLPVLNPSASPEKPKVPSDALPPPVPSKDPEVAVVPLEPQLSTYEKVSFRTKSTIRLVFSILHYLIFAAINIYEIWNDFGMIWKLRKFNTKGKPIRKGDPDIDRERAFLYTVWGWHIIFTVIFMVAALILIISRQVTAIRSLRSQGRSRLRWLVWLAAILAALSSWVKLYALGSVLNKLRYVDQWCASDNLKADIRYTLSGHNKHKLMGTCHPHKATSRIRMSVTIAILNVIFNTVVFYVKEPKGFLTKVLSFVPSLALTGLLYIKPLTSMMTLHYTQRHFTQKGDWSFASECVVALISQVTAALFSLVMAYVVADLHLFSVVITRLFTKCGLESSHHDAALDQAAAAAAAKNKKADPGLPITEAPAQKRGMMSWMRSEPSTSVSLSVQKSEDATAKAQRRTMGIRTAIKTLVMQWFYSGQLAVAFGLLAPILATSSLSIWNFWVGLDLFLGIGMFALYLLLLLVHKRFMPHWE